MNDVTSLSHTRWECKYHVVWIPKGRRKVLFGQLRKNLGEVFHELARQKESKVLEGSILALSRKWHNQVNHGDSFFVAASPPL